MPNVDLQMALHHTGGDAVLASHGSGKPSQSKKFAFYCVVSVALGMIFGMIGCLTQDFTWVKARASRRLFGHALGPTARLPRGTHPTTPFSAHSWTPVSGASSSVAWQNLARLEDENAELKSGLLHMQSQIDQIELGQERTESQRGNANHLTGWNLMGGFGGLAVLALGIRKGLSLASGPPRRARPAMSTLRSPSPQMLIDKQVLSFDQDGVWEGREVVYKKPPPKVLTRINEIGLLSAVADIGLLSKLEEVGAFSKLEEAGAFAFIEKTLPFVDKFKLLKLVDKAIETDASTLFTISGFLLFFTPGIIALTLTGFLPAPEGLFIVPEGAVCGGTAAAGFVLFPLAYLISVLQADDPISSEA